LKIIDISWKDTIPIRHKVLWPNEKPEFCMVEGDKEALHFGVIINNQIVCVASIYINTKSARLRKFATLSQFQGQGIGSFMLNYLVTKLKKDGVDYLWFDARESAVGFYNRLGFGTKGELFYKNEVPYYKMVAHL
jgi:ribosomal protein S18 acetylase RimI-like enzyme